MPFGGSADDVRATNRSGRLGRCGVLVVGAVAAPVLGANGAVSIVGKKFEPATVTIGVGDTVTWTVTQSIGEPHSVTAGTPGEPDQLFDSGIDKLKEDGEDYQFTFDTPGTFKYFCHGPSDRDDRARSSCSPPVRALRPSRPRQA